MAADIRENLPLFTKEGTSHKPKWLLDGIEYKFIEPLNKAGMNSSGAKPRLGKRILGKYKAGTTTSGNDLLFVGVFARVTPA